MLRFVNVCKTYNNSSFTLSSINLEIRQGEFVFLIGKTGAGKTTLIKIAYGEQSPDEGEVYILDSNIARLKPRELQHKRREIGLVFQHDSLISNRTVFENVAFPLYIKSLDRDTVKKRVNIALRLVEMVHREASYPDELSGGEKQKASIARAIISDPQIIIADEPTGNIDYMTTREIMDIFTRINSKGTAVLIATHDMRVVDKYGRRFVELTEGRIMRDVIKAEGK